MSTKKATNKKAQSRKSKKPEAKPRQKPAVPRSAAAKAKGRSSTTKLPAAGSVLHRSYKGRDLEVRVLPDGFEFEGEIFSSLSALAKHITGYPAISGPVFFKTAAPKVIAKQEA